MKTKWVVGLLTMAALAVAAVAGTASATTLCEAQKEIVCPAGERYTPPTKLQGSSPFGVPFELVFGEVTVECNESKIAAETKTNKGPGLELKTEIGVWSNKQNGGECETQGGIKCPTTQWTGLPYTENEVHITYTASGNGNGKLRIEKSGTLEVVCSGVKCIYSKPIELEFKGGKAGAAALKASSVSLDKQAGSNIFCAKTATLSAEYTLSEPAKAVWVSKEP